MRRRLTRDGLERLMEEIARSCAGRRSHRVYVVGGGTAVHAGWRESTVDADLYSDRDEVFRDIQRIKERLDLSVEFVRPEDFVPPLRGSDDRHVFLATVGNVSFYHYDPYAQALAKLERGFDRDLEDVREMLARCLVDRARLAAFFKEIEPELYRFPATDEWTAKVMAVVAAERQCCPFFTFEVVFEPHGRALWLRFRGSEAIKAFVRDNFPLAVPA